MLFLGEKIEQDYEQEQDYEGNLFKSDRQLAKFTNDQRGIISIFSC